MAQGKANSCDKDRECDNSVPFITQRRLSEYDGGSDTPDAAHSGLDEERESDQAPLARHHHSALGWLCVRPCCLRVGSSCAA